jgi:hypothetical protein
MRALVIGAVLVVASGVHAQGVSPGPLASDHAALEGVDNCVRCHSGGDAISAPACLSCHKALGQRIAAKAGYHATAGKDCASCHPDHRGTKAALVRWPGGRDRFDHDKAGYKLTGGHAKVACRDCHKVAFLSGGVASALTAEEKPRTYLGVGTSCASCHKDAHRPSLGTDCQRCHTPVGWHATVAGSFDHSTTKYPLAGAHAKVVCEKCHGGTAQKLANLHPAFDTCQTCHKDPHAGAMGDAKACATCHREAAWKELHYDRKTHAPRTLPLTAGHAKPTCAACHAAKLDQKPAATCTPCHADAHKPSLGTRCETCHQTTAWTTTAAKRDFHDRTAYPLRGLHTTVACERCHDPKRPRATRFRPLAHGKCLDCHADPHAGEAAPPCERCHGVETAWKPARFEVADHAKTAFALDGAHRAVPCAKCHPSAPKPPGFRRGNPACEVCHADPHGGQFAQKGTCATCHGVVAWSPSTFTKDAHAKAGFALAGKHDVACARCHAKQFVGTATECSACHDDRHAGQFAGRSCTECHAGAEWKPTPGFDHARTFALRGRHATAACARCHPKTEIRITPALSVESEVYKLGAGSRDCVGCHRAQHGDPKSGLDRPRQLAAATRACTACHTEASWRDLAVAPLFDHNTTGAPLVGGHAATPCTSCHQPGRRALPALELCSGCHQDRHAGRLGDRCEACHTAASWKQDQLLVDHRRTRLPLVGAHAVQGCPTCHKDAQAGIYRGLDPTCRACHLHTVEDRRPHPDHTKDLAFNTCEHCHSVLAWRPAHIDHDKFWPLTGKHATTACTRCHAPGDPFVAAPTACNACHTQPGAGSPTDHDMFGAACGDVRQCQSCHTTSGWTTSKFPCHPRDFSSSHHGSSCAQCHPSGDNMMYSCTLNCHRGIDNNHPREDGYMRGEQDCAKAGCHFGGRGGGG